MFTAAYPFGNRETFVKGELEVLAKHFSRVYLFPMKGGGTAREVPVNVQVVPLFENFHYSGFQVMKTDPLLFARLFAAEVAASPREAWKDKGEIRSRLLQNMHKARIVEDYLKQAGITGAVYYSYWFDDAATVLSILTSRGHINGFVSRVHGFDLYAERWPGNYIPFRSLQLKSVSHLVAISNMGLQYLKDHHPQYVNKFHLSYMGVPDNGENPFQPSQLFTLVSCSDVIPLKRVHLIAEALKLVTIPLKWIHFGDGEMMGDIRQAVSQLPPGVQYEFRGRQSNEGLMRFYKHNSVNLFIHLSETEGLPVVLQEAASFGIPLMATDVGGVSEIVNESTGILIEVHTSPGHIAKLIVEFAHSEMNTSRSREKARQFWKDNFNAAINYEMFYKSFLQS